MVFDEFYGVFLLVFYGFLGGFLVFFMGFIICCVFLLQNYCIFSLFFFLIVNFYSKINVFFSYFRIFLLFFYCFYRFKYKNICFISLILTMFGINHYKSQYDQQQCVPFKFYNMKLGASAEKINVFRLSAKDFYMNIRKSHSKFPKTINKYTPAPRIYNETIQLEEDFPYYEDAKVPVMKGFRKKPLKTTKKPNISKKNHIENVSELGIFAKNSRKNVEIPITTDKNTKGKITQRPATAKIAKNLKNIALSPYKTRKFHLEMKENFVKVPEIHELIRLASYQKIKRKEKIDAILDIPEKDLLIQRPLTTETLLRLSQQQSIKEKLGKFVEKRSSFYEMG